MLKKGRHEINAFIEGERGCSYLIPRTPFFENGRGWIGI
jgi:hypothetical protein